jgi:hypothetical protein
MGFIFCYSNVIKDNIIRNHSNSGIWIEYGYDNNITGGEIYDNNINSYSSNGGILINGQSDPSSGNNLVSGVYMHNNKYSAVQIKNSYDDKIIGNNIDDNCGGESGLYLDGNSGVIISSNNITDGTGYGIEVLGGDATILDNLIKNNTFNGIQLYSSAIVNAENNKFIANRGGDGIYGGAGNFDWIINGEAVCRDNNINIYGSLTFNGGTLELDNCTIYLNGTIIAESSGIYTSMNSATGAVEQGIEKEFAFPEANSNITLFLGDNVTTEISVAGIDETGTTPSGSLISVQAIEVFTDDETKGNLTWALIKIFYNQTEIDALG